MDTPDYISSPNAMALGINSPATPDSISSNSTGVGMSTAGGTLDYVQHNAFDLDRQPPPRPKSEYAEITTADRTMKETALHQLQHEIEQQLNRLKNLDNRQFLDEMEVIKKSLALTDDEMLNLSLMTLRSVPIRHRTCNCCYIHIQQKYHNCLFTTRANGHTATASDYHHRNGTDSDTAYMNGLHHTDDGLSSDNSTATTPTTPAQDKTFKFGQPKHAKLESFRTLFANMSNFETPQTTDKAPTDIESILESEEMEYKLPPRFPSNSHIAVDAHSTHTERTADHSTAQSSGNTSNSQHLPSPPGPHETAKDDLSTKMYIDIQPDAYRQYGFCLYILHKIRTFFLFWIPFLHTFVSALVALMIILEICTDTYYDSDTQCQMCHQIHDIFYGPKVHEILQGDDTRQLYAFYFILIARVSTILCWYILLTHSLLFHVTACCCCCSGCRIGSCCFCGIENGNNSGHYQLIENDTTTSHAKYASSKQTTVLLNFSISIDEHLRSKSRIIKAMNFIRFYLRMVMVPNVLAIFVHLVLFDHSQQVFIQVSEHEMERDEWKHRMYWDLYFNLLVLFAFYWSLSDWFYFSRDNMLVSWCDVYRVLLIDFATNWIKFILEMLNFILFLFLCIVIVIPLTVFVFLRVLLCPCFFGYNNNGCILCNLYQNFVEFLLKLIKWCYV